MIHTGNYLDVLTDMYDVMITDPPYSTRCHSGQSDRRGEIEYSCWTQIEYQQLVRWALEHVRGWWVIITDHICWRWVDDLMNLGRYPFNPVPIVVPGLTCRLQGDGPSSWVFWCHVSRPRDGKWAKWRTLPGAYVVKKDYRHVLKGQKSLSAMLSLVRDYSRKGMTIVDPCVGTGTTLLAARQLGRNFAGAEIDAQRADCARRRLAEPYTNEMFDPPQAEVRELTEEDIPL